MSQVFIVSDTHFFHRKIIDYEQRPYEDVESMNSDLIRRWNAVVKKSDMVIHLGDFSFAGKEATKSILSRLNGIKRLIMGNHDRPRSRTWWLDAGFDQVSEEPILYKGFYILSHEPVYMNANMPYINVHGHTHSQKQEGTHYINACVENWNYSPFPFEKILELSKEFMEKEEQE